LNFRNSHWRYCSNIKWWWRYSRTSYQISLFTIKGVEWSRYVKRSWRIRFSWMQENFGRCNRRRVLFIDAGNCATSKTLL